MKHPNKPQNTQAILLGSPRDKWMPIASIAVIAIIGAALFYVSKAASLTAQLQPELGTVNGNAMIMANDVSASGAKYVKFKAPVSVVYCGGRSFSAPAHCIGAAEWATYKCTTNTQCQTAGFKCYGYMNGDLTKVYDLTGFGSSHSGGKSTVINTDICGKDFGQIIKGQVSDSTSGTVPQNSKHVVVQNRTQGTFNSYLTGNEYDPTKP